MRYRILLLGICLLGGLFLGCEDEDVKELRRDLDKQAERLAALEAWQREINNNLGALQALVDALKNNKYITSVIETAEGYTLSLSDGNVMHIYHGAKGEMGESGGVVMPLISVRDSSDGHVYWTVNGTLLRDEAGSAVRADGEKGDPGEEGETGEQGPAGVSPRVRIDIETNEWEISVDGGKTWKTTGVKATGPAGDKGETGGTGPAGPTGPEGPAGGSVFAENGVEVKEDYVEFTLADGLGTHFRLPRYRSFSLRFPRGTSVRIPLGVEKSVPFILTESGGYPEVNVLGNGGWQAEVRMDDIRADSGVIVLRGPATVGKASIVVLLNDGLGGCWTYRLQAETLSTPKMLYVAGGSLAVIGSHGEGWRLTDYWLSQTEVTISQYCDFLNSLEPAVTPETFLNMARDTLWFEITANLDFIYSGGKWQPRTGLVYYPEGNKTESYGNYPIESLSWYGAEAYCRWAGGCLPTRAQWEYAARGGENNPLGKTQMYSGSDDIDEVAWYSGNKKVAGGMLLMPQNYVAEHPVGTKASNFLGFYDMSGNVEEWCSDYSGENYPENGLKDHMDPQGPKYGLARTDRVVLGGEIISRPQECSVASFDFFKASWFVGGIRLAYKAE